MTVDRTTAPAGSGPGRRALRVAAAAAADALLVVAFVLLGRREHDSGGGIPGLLGTLGPFLAGLAAGWLLARAWRRPAGLPLPGITVWAVTVAAGMLLRAVTGHGVQPAFALVTAVVLGVFLLGWRGLVAAGARFRRR